MHFDSSVRCLPQMRNFVRDQGLRGILPQVPEGNALGVHRVCIPRIKFGTYADVRRNSHFRLRFAVSEILREIGQSHQNDAQSGHVNEIGIGIEHPREKHGKSGPQDGPDDEHMKSGQVITSSGSKF